MVTFSYPFDKDRLARVPTIVDGPTTTLILRSMMDTGADFIFVDSVIADYLGLERVSSLDVGAAGGPLKADEARMDQISISSQDLKHGISKKNVEVFIVENLGEEMVLGTSFFEGKCKLLFDYVDMTFKIEGDWRLLGL